PHSRGRGVEHARRPGLVRTALGKQRARQRPGPHALLRAAPGARPSRGQPPRGQNHKGRPMMPHENIPNPVWIIDDDRSIRWVFEKALAREGIVHRTFGAAQEALDRLPLETPQVVVSDIRMPGTTGLEFMRQLKSRLPSTP